MRRLLTTVAFSALALGVAAPGWAADTTSTKNGSTSQTMSSGQTTTSAQSNTNTSPGKAMSGSTSASDQAATKPATKKRSTHRTSSRGPSSSDHMANDLNRQELAKMSGAGTTSYGSSGTTAPSSGASTTR